MAHLNTSARLGADNAFVAEQARQSTFEFGYRTGMVPDKLGKSFAPACAPYPAGCRQFHVNRKVVDDYTKVVPGARGWGREKSSSTELIGGPFKARGEGALQNPDALSEAWTPSGGFEPVCNRKIAERQWDTWSCVNAPMAYEGKDWGGADTRQGVQFITKC